MGRSSKCVLVGLKGIGKTTMLEQLIYGNFDKQDIHPTIEDIYAAVIDTDRGTKEGIRFYDTEGFSLTDTNTSEIALPKHYHSLADAFLLVYATDNRQSFEIIDILKKDIEKNREKKEIVIVLVGINKPNTKREVDPSFAVSWATREKIRSFEVTITDRKDLVLPFTYLASKLNPPATKGTAFGPLGMVSRNKVKE